MQIEKFRDAAMRRYYSPVKTMEENAGALYGAALAALARVEAHVALGMYTEGSWKHRRNMAAAFRLRALGDVFAGR